MLHTWTISRDVDLFDGANGAQGQSFGAAVAFTFAPGQRLQILGDLKSASVPKAERKVSDGKFDADWKFDTG